MSICGTQKKKKGTRINKITVSRRKQGDRTSLMNDHVLGQLVVQFVILKLTWIDSIAIYIHLSAVQQLGQLH